MYSLLLFPLAALISGIWLVVTFLIPFFFSLLSLCASSVALLICFIKKYRQIELATLCLLFFASGMVLIHLQHKENNIKLSSLAGKTISLQGTVSDYTVQKTYNSTKEMRVKVRVTQLENASDESLFLPFSLLCYLKTNNSLRIGDHIQIKNVKISTTQNSTQLTNAPPFSAYLLKEGALATLFLTKYQWNLLSTFENNFSRYLTSVRDSLYSSLQQKIDPSTFGLFSTLFLGNKNETTNNELRHYFNFWGISHVLARSGLHIALFILLWSMLLSFIPLPFIIKQVVLLIISCVYFLLSWTSISFLRAFTVFALHQVGILFGKQTYFLYLLSLVCLLILLFNPIQLFFLDFQLTFSLAFGLAWFFGKKPA